MDAPSPSAVVGYWVELGVALADGTRPVGVAAHSENLENGP